MSSIDADVADGTNVEHWCTLNTVELVAARGRPVPTKCFVIVSYHDVSRKPRLAHLTCQVQTCTVQGRAGRTAENAFREYFSLSNSSLLKKSHFGKGFQILNAESMWENVLVTGYFNAAHLAGKINNVRRCIAICLLLTE